MSSQANARRSPPEEALWAAFPRGARVDLRDGDPGADDPSHGDRWGDERVVRAEVIVALMLGVQESEPGHAQLVSLRGARITGQLALSFAETRTTLLLEDCYFEQRIDLYWTSLGFTSFRGSVLPGMVASNLQVKGHLRLTGCSIGGEVRLRGARIAGALLLDGAQLHNPDGWSLDGERLTVGGDVNMHHGFVSQGEVRLYSAQIGGSLSLVEAHLSAPTARALSADNIRTDGSIYAHRAIITGQILLRHAALKGGLFLSGARLSNPDGPALLGARLDAEEGLFLDCLICDGEVRLSHAHVGRNMILTEAKLHSADGKALTAPGIRVEGPVEAMKLSARGKVDLSDAQVTGPVQFQGAHLENVGGTAFDADGLQAGAAIDACEGFTAQGSIHMTNARVASYICLDNATLLNPVGDALMCWRTDSPELILKPRNVQGTVNLQHARFAILRDDELSWPSDLRLDGLTYNILDPQVAAHKRLAWLARDPKAHLTSAYEQLASVYRHAGRDADARSVQLAKQQRARPELPWYARIWGHLQDVTVGYGYRPVRAALWLLALLAIGTAVFSAHPPPTFPQESAPPFNPFVYTLNLVLPIVDFGQARAYDPHGTEQWLSYGLILAGWILATTAASGIIRVLRRD